MSADPFVGRTRELERGAQAVERALRGEGALLLFFGEAGLGKTRIAQTVARTAAARGARVAWGRAWEAGGAPPFWPWVQVFRALGAADDPFAADDRDGGLGNAQARFARFDAAARWLKSASNDEGLVLVLDDLHAADISTLLFLQFLSRDLHSCRLLIIGTYRDAEARLAAEVGALLAKIARDGEAFALARLSLSEVEAWILAASGGTAEAAHASAERMYRVSEGNPLFVHELLSLEDSATVDATMIVGLRTILDQHLARVSAETLAVLEIGSVLGRDLDPELVVGVSGLSSDEVQRALHEARLAGLLSSILGGDRLSFSHILVRERLYGELLPSRRAALHARIGEQILAAGGNRATALHHLAAGASAPARIAEVARDAARTALARLAFEDVSVVCERALAMHAMDDELTVDLELLLGESLIRAGRLTAGQAHCATAAQRAKRIGSATRQAQAALVYATELLTGTIDRVMVDILRDAIERLPTEDSPLRARLLSRYAASLVPPRSAEEATDVVARGEAAIAMARRMNDPDTLLFALQYGGSSLGYMVSSRKRHELLRELFMTAQELGRPLELLQVGGGWIASLREHAGRADADAALLAYERLVREFPQPLYQWRAPMIRATFACLAEDFELAERLIEQALAIAEEGEIRAGRVAGGLARLALAHLRGDPSSIGPRAELAMAVAGRMSGADPFIAWVEAATGRHEEARVRLAEVAKVPQSFPSCLISGETVCLLRDLETAAHLYPWLVKHAKDNALFWGPFGSVVFGPTHRVAGDVARLLGKTDEARALYAESIALGDRMDAPVFATLARRGLEALDAEPRERAIAPVSVGPGSARPRIELNREGEMWRVSSSTGKDVLLKDSKGLQYLADLVARPGQELHVTQLAGLSDVSGDAGNRLDDRAKAQYKARLEDLRDQHEEARRFGDPTRAARAEAEMEAIGEELARAVGLGGRDRKVGSHVERVRINVQRRLRDAIQRIEEHDPALGRYFSATIKTGNFCIFTPV